MKTDPQSLRRRMQAVKQKNTGPEMIVRSVLHRAGLRFRLHANELPGRPDIVFRPRRKAIFVHGCFWHKHDCKRGKLPKSRLEYWLPKLSRNVERDRAHVKELERIGWTVLVIWECETKDADLLKEKLLTFVKNRLP